MSTIDFKKLRAKQHLIKQAPASKNHPETSHKAYVKMQTKSICARFLHQLDQNDMRGGDGLTWCELKVLTPGGSYPWCRVSNLVDSGFAYYTGEYRVNPDTGEDCQIAAITDQGRHYMVNIYYPKTEGGGR